MKRKWYCRLIGTVAFVITGAVLAEAQFAPSIHGGSRLLPAQVRTLPALALRGVTVIDVRDGQQRRNQTVVVVGSRIRAVGPARAVPLLPGTRVIEARGKYLVPGLWDMHAHPWGYTEIYYPLLIANGVTGIRDAGSNMPLATLNRWKQEIAAGTRVGPRLFVAGPSVFECPGIARTHTICVSTPSEARLVVDFLKLAGADFIKTYNLSRELSLAVAAEARRLGIPFGGHFLGMPGVVSMSGLEASDSGARFLDHDTYFLPNVCGDQLDSNPVFDRERCAAAGRRLRQNRTWLVETPALGVNLFPQLAYERIRRYVVDSANLAKPMTDFLAAHGDSVARWQPSRPMSFADWVTALRRPATPFGWPPPRSRNYSEMPELPILAGTDFAMNWSGIVVTAGFSLHETLATFVLHGMTPLQALQTATSNPALAMSATDSLGTVEAGKVADLVLLDGDPLADITNTQKIRAVVANGRYFDRAALDHLLAQAEHAARR